MLQDLILAAINDASRKANEAMQNQLGGMMAASSCPACRARAHWRDVPARTPHPPHRAVAAAAGHRRKSAQRLAFFLLKTPRDTGDSPVRRHPWT